MLQNFFYQFFSNILISSFRSNTGKDEYFLVCRQFISLRQENLSNGFQFLKLTRNKNAPTFSRLRSISRTFGNQYHHSNLDQLPSSSKSPFFLVCTKDPFPAGPVAYSHAINPSILNLISSLLIVDLKSPKYPPFLTHSLDPCTLDSSFLGFSFLRLFHRQNILCFFNLLLFYFICS